MEKVKGTIVKIARYDKDPQGQPYTGQYGPYKKVRVALAEIPGRVYSGFENSPSSAVASWQVGDQVEFDCETRTGADGKTYYNFKAPNPRDQLEKRINTLEKEMAEVKKEIAHLKSDNPLPADTEDEVNIDDIPF